MSLNSSVDFPYLHGIVEDGRAAANVPREASLGVTGMVDSATC